MDILKFDEFMRSLKQNLDAPHSLLLGAGASIESGVQCASDCIWDWKKEIFLSQNPTMLGYNTNTKTNIVRKNIQSWLNQQGIYPPEGSDNEYSFFAEKAYPIEDDRRKYFQKIISTAKPSIGYHLIAYMAELGIFKSVWTTNFDGLMEKCAHQYSLTPISITSDTLERFYRTEVKNEILTIALHGDYKYGKLKNTVAELDSQNDVFVKALRHEMTNRDLIVIGYSGRDRSLMAALKQAYSVPGAGKLFWCGYGQNYNEPVNNLIDYINKSGRCAYYIPTNGFDETFYDIARHCLGDSKIHLQKIEEIKSNLSVTVNNIKSNFFLFEVNHTQKIIDTNLHPIIIPQNCYQFEIKLEENESRWDFCKSLYKHDIMAVPYKGLIYAWGEKHQIIAICKDKLKSEITLSPLTNDAIQYNTSFKELILKTVVCLLAQNSGLPYSKNKIWDKDQIFRKNLNGKNIAAYKGICISIIVNEKIIYISFSPSFCYDENYILSKEEKKLFADSFNLNINGQTPNYNIKQYINQWVNNLIGESPIELHFPIHATNKDFIFKFGQNSAQLKLNCHSQYKIKLPATLSEKRRVFNGLECPDPNLVFYNTQRNSLIRDFHPMRGLIQNAPVDIPINIKNIKSTISLGVICPTSHNKEFLNFLTKLNTKCDVRYNTDYVISFPNFYNAFKTNIDIPLISDNRWQELNANKDMTIKQFGETLARKIDQLSAMAVDVIVIYIPKEYELYTVYSDENEKYDLHDYIKAYAAQKQIATQFIREKTIESNLMCQIMWALSLAIYVKSNRIPWLVSNNQNDTAFAGIGYSVQNTKQGTNVIIGCSHIYSSDGQGLKYKLSKINDVTFDNKQNPYLSENEAYKLGMNIKELFYSSFTEMPKRVVVHKRTPFRKEEIKGLIESLSSAGITNINLLEITFEDSIKCFAYNKNITDIDGFPVKRGLCFALNKNTMLLYTHGIAPSIINSSRSYIQGGKTIPMPLKIVNHYGNSSMQQIASEILGLTKMNWNSFGLYTKLPCTLESSSEIARIGWLLSKYEGALYEYRFFM